jgi:hypothetical protein
VTYARNDPVKTKISILSSRKAFLRLAAATALLLALAPMARAQSVDFDPAALSKQRSAILLKATHAPIADLENDVNHLAVLSETCRAESGAKACGLVRQTPRVKQTGRPLCLLRQEAGGSTRQRAASQNRQTQLGSASLCFPMSW